mgnify:CR=1 FL=1
MKILYEITYGTRGNSGIPRDAKQVGKALLEKKGFSTEIIQQIEQCTNVPIIASGGAGSIEDFVELFNTTNATGGLAASIFHYNEIPIPVLKQYLKEKQIVVQ